MNMCKEDYRIVILHRVQGIIVLIAGQLINSQGLMLSDAVNVDIGSSINYASESEGSLKLDNGFIL